MRMHLRMWVHVAHLGDGPEKPCEFVGEMGWGGQEGVKGTLRGELLRQPGLPRRQAALAPAAG